MISDDKKWHYFALIKLHALLGRIITKHEGDLYCLNCFRSYSTKNKLKKHYKACKNHDYCYVEMTKEDNNYLNTIMEKNL